MRFMRLVRFMRFSQRFQVLNHVNLEPTMNRD